ncbi:MAG: hypothetical protein JO122_14050, partial [Acetobacteraceae bacterium]|nr:hypothetical protein [Acetobacteraceae bacterium]
YLGRALTGVGEREDSTAHLDEALTAERAALEEQTRQGAFKDWADTEDNLASTLLALGKRKSGTARLEEAVAAERLALEQRQRDQTSRGWAFSEMGLGNALAALAERQRSVPRTEEAIASIRGAAAVYQQMGDSDRLSEAQSPSGSWRLNWPGCASDTGVVVPPLKATLDLWRSVGSTAADLRAPTE